MQIYLIRHAQSANNHLYNCTGSSTGRSDDPDLSPTGVQQAGILAATLGQALRANGHKQIDVRFKNDLKLTHLYTSPMIRAIKTALAISGSTGIAPAVWVDLHERGGIFLEDEKHHKIGLPGKPRGYFEHHFPNLILPPDLREEGWWNRPFEQRADCKLRAERVLKDLLARHGATEDRVALVSHESFGNMLLSQVLKPSADTQLWFTVNNASITRIDVSGELVEMVYFNRVDFLPPELVS